MSYAIFMISTSFIRGRTTAIPTTDYKVESYNADPIQDGINYVIHTGIGSGPRVVTTEVVGKASLVTDMH